MKSRRLDSTRLESSRLVLLKGDPTYRKSSDERLSEKILQEDQCIGYEKSATRLDSTRVVSTRLAERRPDLPEV